MTEERRKQAEEQSTKYGPATLKYRMCFVAGVQWADANPPKAALEDVEFVKSFPISLGGMDDISSDDVWRLLKIARRALGIGGE